MQIAQKRIAALATAVTAIVAAIAPATLADDYSYVNAEHLNVRAAGTVRSSIVATVDKGYRMTVMEDAARGWKHVLLENGQEGYVNGKYLSETVPQYEKVESTEYSVKVPHAFLRSDGLLRKVAVVNSGDQLEAVSDRVFFGRWIRVRVAFSSNPAYVGRVGYVSKRLVTPSTIGQATEDAVQSSDESQVTDSGSEDSVPVELNSAPAEDSASSDTTDSGTTDSGSDVDVSSLIDGL
jgi:uncharacterized protein YgiM (DUF1202 family)